MGKGKAVFPAPQPKLCQLLPRRNLIFVKKYPTVSQNCQLMVCENIIVGIGTRSTRGDTTQSSMGIFGCTHPPNLLHFICLALRSQAGEIIHATPPSFQYFFFLYACFSGKLTDAKEIRQLSASPAITLEKSQWCKKIPKKATKNKKMLQKCSTETFLCFSFVSRIFPSDFYPPSCRVKIKEIKLLSDKNKRKVLKNIA